MIFRLDCWWWERALARQAVTGEAITPGSRLARHIAICSRCARAQRELSELARGLNHLPSAPTLSPAFNAMTQTRLRAFLSAAPRSSSGSTAGALCLGATALVVWLMLPRPLPPGKTAGTPSAQDGETQASQTRLVKMGSEPHFETPLHIQNHKTAARGSSPQKKALHPNIRLHSRSISNYPLPQSRRLLADSQRRRRHALHHRASLFVRYRPASGSSPSLIIAHRASPVLIRRGTLRECGAIYEAGGDYVSAAEAYRQANQQEANSDLLLAAAQSSERAEDTGQALETYAQLLTQNTESVNRADASDTPNE